MISARTPAACSAPVAPSAVGPTRIATPAKPTTIPTTASRGSRSLRTTRPSTAIQTGIIATSSAAMPDGIVCSPHATMPMPPPSSSAPTIVESRSSRRVGRLIVPRSRTATQVRRIRPAEPNRAAAIRNGGMVWTPTAMARYVEPQTP